MARDSSDNGFDISEYAGVSVGAREESDSCGLPAAKHPTFSLEIDLGDDSPCVLYGLLVGTICRDRAYTEIQFPFQGWHRHQGKWVDGVWLATISGKRLKQIFGHLRDGRRVSVHPPQSPPPNDKPDVTGLAIRPLKVLDEEEAT